MEPVASIDKIFFLGGISGARLEFHMVLTLFWTFLISLSLSVTREATLIYQFVTNNQSLFHLWWKENLVKHQKLSKYYKQGCRSLEQKVAKGYYKSIKTI